MNAHIIAQNMKIYNTDYHLETQHIHRRSSSLALSAVEFWIRDINSKVQSSETTTTVPTYARFFYVDYLYPDLMFRWNSHDPDNQPPQLVLARIALHALFRGKGHFKKLLSGLEQIAQQNGATLIVEQANPKLSRILMGQGYIRCIGRDANEASICADLSGTWKNQAANGQSMGLIALPRHLLKQIDGRRIASDLQTKMNCIVQEETERFHERLHLRLECEILPEAMC